MKALRNNKWNILLFGLLVSGLSLIPAFVGGFTSLSHANLQRRFSINQQSQITLSLVTEGDVLKAVENAEKLWAEALEARKVANALSDRAEEEAEAASTQAKEVEESMRDRSKPISMEKLAQADAVSRANLDAGSLVNKALQASDDADRLLAKAELALEQSEECLEQHLKDCPDSPLA
jgi:hypothetical protein